MYTINLRSSYLHATEKHCQDAEGEKVMLLLYMALPFS